MHRSDLSLSVLIPRNPGYCFQSRKFVQPRHGTITFCYVIGKVDVITGNVNSHSYERPQS